MAFGGKLIMNIRNRIKLIMTLFSLMICFSVTGTYSSAEEINTYYVGGVAASDTKDGLSSLYPFATLEKAVEAIGDGTGTIIIQSDLTLIRPIAIKGDVTIISDGVARTISRSSSFSYSADISNNIWSMLIVSGKLAIGNKDSSESTPNIIFNGWKTSPLTGAGEIIYVESNGVFDLYNGASIRSNHKNAGVHNEGIFGMQGGMITYNDGIYAGGVYNCQNGVFTMSGGSIDNNDVVVDYNNGVLHGSGGVYNTGSSTFIMSGGSIANNYGYTSGGIYNGTNCTFIMSDGIIEKNTSILYAQGIFNEGANFIIGLNADIALYSDIWLVNGSVITISSQLKEIDLLLVTLAVFDSTIEKYVPNYVLGTQVSKAGDGYQLSSANYCIQLSEDGYGTSQEGMLQQYLVNEWLSIPEVTYDYIGSEISPKATLTDGLVTLQEGTDYTVFYGNNIVVGKGHLLITGIGNYRGTAYIEFTIQKTVAESILSIPDRTFSAERYYTIDDLETRMNLMEASTVQVELNGGTTNMGILWEITDGAYNPKGGAYTLTGTLISDYHVSANGLTCITHITVTPVIAELPTFTDITVPINTNSASTANDLGSDILPTSGSYAQAGTYRPPYTDPGIITYTINWGNQTLNRNDNNSKTTFIGTVTYANYPEWLTIPNNTTVSRTVGVVGEIQSNTDGVTIYNGIDYSSVYNFNYYISTFTDIKNQYGDNDIAALEHFVNSGMSEGRRGSAEFDVQVYKNNYIDLKNGLGDNLAAYYMHYIYNGKAEGRVATNSQSNTERVTVYNGVDYSSVYNFDYYISTYPDMKNGCGDNDEAALAHFVNNGMSEGRQGSTEFNVQVYKNNYIDLQNGFGDNLASYYLHYIMNGRNEGRLGA